MSLVEMSKDEILSAIEDRRLDEADLLELVTDNDFEIALAATRSPDSTGPILDIAAHHANAGNVEQATDFLNALALTEAGQDYMVNKAAMVPAFTNVTLEPATPLSKSVMEWNAAGKTYSWQQYKLPDGFGMGTLGAIYELLASGAIDEAAFEQMMKDAIATIPSL